MITTRLSLSVCVSVAENVSYEAARSKAESMKAQTLTGTLSPEDPQIWISETLQDKFITCNSWMI
jgi:hypothetical protein